MGETEREGRKGQEKDGEKAIKRDSSGSRQQCTHRAQHRMRTCQQTPWRTPVAVLAHVAYHGVGRASAPALEKQNKQNRKAIDSSVINKRKTQEVTQKERFGIRAFVVLWLQERLRKQERERGRERETTPKELLSHGGRSVDSTEDCLRAAQCLKHYKKKGETIRTQLGEERYHIQTAPWCFVPSITATPHTDDSPHGSSR